MRMQGRHHQPSRCYYGMILLCMNFSPRTAIFCFVVLAAITLLACSLYFVQKRQPRSIVPQAPSPISTGPANRPSTSTSQQSLQQTAIQSPATSNEVPSPAAFSLPPPVTPPITSYIFKNQTECSQAAKMSLDKFLKSYSGSPQSNVASKGYFFQTNGRCYIEIDYDIPCGAGGPCHTQSLTLDGSHTLTLECDTASSSIPNGDFCFDSSDSGPPNQVYGTFGELAEQIMTSEPAQ